MLIIANHFLRLGGVVAKVGQRLGCFIKQLTRKKISKNNGSR